MTKKVFISNVLVGSLLLLCMAITTQTAFADITAEQYHDFKNSAPQFEDYLTGVGRGVYWTNVALKFQDKPTLFCMPEDLALDQGIILSVIDQEIRNPSSGKKEWDPSTPVELIAVVAFMNKFPCK